MSKYNYTYFHKELLRLQSKDFEQARHLTEYDVFIQALNEKKIKDLGNIDWRWISEDLIGEVVHNQINDYGETCSSFTELKVEEFINQITSREQRIKLLEFLRDNCRECLFNKWFFEDDLCSFETECARLISREYRDGEHKEGGEEEKSTQEPPVVDQYPDILQIVRDINSGKLRYDKVDWELQLKTLLFLCRLMPKKFPNVILIWGILVPLDDPTIKMDIIGQLQDAAPKCFNSPNDAQDFINDCDCIYRVCMKVREYNLRNGTGDRRVWTDERKDLNDLANIFSDEMVDAQWMVGMIEEMKRSEVESRKHPLIEIVLKSNRNLGQLSIDNIVDFAKRLYIAEGFRQLILSGQEDYWDIPTLEKFNWRIRNKCFDVYIDLRKEQIKEQLNQKNTRIDGADDFEALEELTKEEIAIVERENEFDCEKGSPAYNAMWYPGRKLILDMINVFIKYLPKKIDKLRKAELAKQGILQIGHVDHLYMGDNVQTKIVKGHE